jgi:predicted phosphodiesterase
MEINKDLLKAVIAHPVKTINDVRKTFGLNEMEARRYIFVAENIEAISGVFETDRELVEQNVRYKKQQQKFADINRVERKSFREYARVENSIEEYIKELVRVFDENPYKPSGVLHTTTGTTIGVIQLSDLHFNELINIKSNQYDFNIASKRLQKLAREARKYFLVNGVTDVFILCSGDCLNSDRRLDELLAMATNRSKATFIATQILENMIVDLNNHFNLHIAGVCGNESRVGKDFNWGNELVSDNYDFTIFNILRYKLKDAKGINFLGMSDKPEEVIEINGKNFLMLHGNQLSKDITKDVSKLIAKYAQVDIIVDFVIFGHLHEAMIADRYARSSSLCGSNNYSEDALLLNGKASQNIYLVFPEDRIDAIKVDLQDTKEYPGYNNKDWQDAYNPKSVEKLHKQETILRITI